MDFELQTHQQTQRTLSNVYFCNMDSGKEGFRRFVDLEGRISFGRQHDDILCEASDQRARALERAGAKTTRSSP